MKQLDKLTNKANRNKKTLTFLIVLFMIGILVGSLFIVILNTTDKTLVKEYLDKFMSNLETNKLNYITSLTSSLVANIFFVTIIWLLGISVIGLPIILFLYFAKAFILGFSISSMFYNYKLKGIMLAFFYIFPHHILNILIFTFLTIYSMSLSIKISKTLMAKKTIDFKVIMSKYTVVFGISIIGIIITSILEVFLMPNLIKLILPIIK